MNTVSVSEAARVLGIDRKTVQRYISNGRVKIQGGARRGRYAGGLDLGDVRRALSLPLRDGRDVSRAGFRSATEKVRKFLDECGRDAAVDVARKLLAAAVKGADLDFLLFCVDRLNTRDALFVDMVTRREVPRILRTPLNEFAVRHLDDILGGEEPCIGAIEFGALWKAFARACFITNIEAEVAIVHNSGSGKATLELVPRWLDGAPEGSLPVVGGHHSVATVRKTRDTARINRAATKASNALGAKKAEEIIARIGAMKGLQDESVLGCSDAWHAMLEVADRAANGGVGGRGLCGGDRELNGLYTSFIAAAGELGLSLEELRVLVRAWKRLAGDVHSRVSFPFDDRRANDTDGSGIRICRTVVARIFGVSRVTMAEWMRDARRRPRGR